MTSLLLYPDLERDEGRKLVAYKDTMGNWTIGVGHKDNHLHEGVIWTNVQVDSQLRADIATAVRCLDGAPAFKDWWTKLNDFRQDALVNMAFNMGVGTLATFTTFLSLLRTGQYALAADDALHTLWAKQVGARARRVAEQIRTGVHQQ